MAAAGAGRVLVVAVLAGLLLGTLHPHGQGSIGAKATPTPTPVLHQVHHLGPNEVLPSVWIDHVQMLSSSEGWAVGETVEGCKFAGVATCGSLLLHYTNDQWTEAGDPLPLVLLLTHSMVSPTEGWAGGLSLSPGLEQLARSSGRHELCSDPRYACLFDRPERTLGTSGG